MNATAALGFFLLSIVTGTAGVAVAHAPVDNPSQVRAHGKLAAPALALYEPTKETPVIRLGEITIVAPAPRSAPAKAKVAAPLHWVCGDWEDSYVGGRYQRCDWR